MLHRRRRVVLVAIAALALDLQTVGRQFIRRLSLPTRIFDFTPLPRRRRFQRLTI
jgi:hypothetical protein